MVKKYLTLYYKKAVSSISGESFANDQTMTNLKKLAKSVNSYIINKQIHANIKVLVPTSFNAGKDWWIHDGIITAALRIRGAEIIPVICDRVQSDECMFSSGEWQDSRSQNFHNIRDKICDDCQQRSHEMWDIWGLNPVQLKSFITREEILRINDSVSELMKGDWRNATIENYAAGYNAWKATVNNDLQFDITDDWKERALLLSSQHLYNIMVLFKVYERVFKVFSPDRVFGNGGFYYQWGVVNHISTQNNVPYYRYHKIGISKNSWNYARNSNDLFGDGNGESWESWKEQPLTVVNEKRVVQELLLRGLQLEHDINLDNTRNDIIKRLGLDINKPIVLATTGVAWDATTNSPSHSYENMYEWLWDTISWFETNTEAQLIIRVHPAENVEMKINPVNRTRFEAETKKREINIPKNVRIISPDDPISTYDLFHIAKLGMVYLSTTGLEMACLGLPVIVVGQAHFSEKGFTYDPENREEYLNIMSEVVLNDNHKSNHIETQQLARKYFFYYSFHNSINMGFMDQTNKESNVLKELEYKDLLPGANPYLDYICDAILTNSPINSENLWPPEKKDISVC